MSDKYLREKVINDIASKERLSLLDLQVIGLMKIDTNWRENMWDHILILRLITEGLFYLGWIRFWEDVDRQYGGA